jgi:long-chain fatty acid transport protein
MRRTRAGILSAVAIVVVGWGAVTAVAQTQIPLINPNFYGGGAKAAALAGAFIGVADDGSAGYWNPAGLTLNDRVYTMIDWGFGKQKVTNTLTSNQELSSLYNNISDQTVTHFCFISFQAPVHIKGQMFHLSASWNRGTYDTYEANYQTTDFSDIPPDPTGQIELLNYEEYALRYGGPEVATLAVATQFKEEVFSAGFGLNLYTGNAYDSTQDIIDVNETLFGTTIPIRVAQDNSDQQAYSGLSFNIGGLFQTQQLNVGLNVHTPYTLTTNNDMRSARTVSQITSDSILQINQTSVLIDTKTKLDMPLQIGVGFAYRPQENLLLAVDYEYKAFSKSDLFVQEDVLDPKSEFVSTGLNWKDAHQIRLGFEYQINVGWGTVPVRAGFRNESVPYSNLINVRDYLAIESPPTTYDQGDQVTGEVYSLGTGLFWNKIRLDLTWELQTLVYYSSGVIEDSFLKPEFIQEQNNSKQRLLVGFTGFF